MVLLVWLRRESGRTESVETARARRQPNLNGEVRGEYGSARWCIYGIDKKPILCVETALGAMLNVFDSAGKVTKNFLGSK